MKMLGKYSNFPPGTLLLNKSFNYIFLILKNTKAKEHSGITYDLKQGITWRWEHQIFTSEEMVIFSPVQK